MTDSKMPNTRLTNQLDSLGDTRDAADLNTLFDLFSSLAHTLDAAVHAPAGSPESRGQGDMGKILRLSIVHLWQEPRMPGGGRPKAKHDHNKPFVYPWSERARDLFFARKADKSVSTANMLVLEHTYPVKLLVDHLLNLLREGCTREQWIKYLREAHEGLSFVVLLKEEDNMLNAVGLRASTVPLHEDPRPLARYIKAGVQGEFMSLLDDPRGAGLPGATV